MATLHLLVGLPGSGKTTKAKQLADAAPALRLTPDEWMIPLFGESDAGGRRDVLEGRLITVAVQVLRLQTDVVLDFGCWGRDERSALRWLTEREGAVFDLVYLPVDRETQLRRITQRWEATPQETYPMAAAEVDAWREQFEEPDEAEATGSVAVVPPSWASWLVLAQQRWPSLTA